ncbi:MAG: S1 RNA-binding domain-containing protein, partial [Rhodospirillaceae bacterium]|nr:S1 RNA-binding domain-containing protein [Rhodospirillaceae bacterium]
DMVKAKVLDVDVEKERISLGLKQLSEDPFASEMGSIKKGDTVTCTVTGITTGGIEVKVGDGLPGFIRKTDLSRERSEQRPDRYAAGEKVDAKVTQIDASGRKLTLSIKNLEAAEEKKAMKEYGSSDSGASLGDILGAALKEKQGSSDTDDTAEKKPAKKAAAKKAAPKKAAAKEDTADEADDKAEEKPAKKAAAKKPAAKKPAAKKAAPKKAAAKKAKDD